MCSLDVSRGCSIGTMHFSSCRSEAFHCFSCAPYELCGIGTAFSVLTLTTTQYTSRLLILKFLTPQHHRVYRRLQKDVYTASGYGVSSRNLGQKFVRDSVQASRVTLSLGFQRRYRNLRSFQFRNIHICDICNNLIESHFVLPSTTLYFSAGFRGR